MMEQLINAAKNHPAVIGAAISSAAHFTWAALKGAWRWLGENDGTDGLRLYIRTGKTVPVVKESLTTQPPKAP